MSTSEEPPYKKGKFTMGYRDYFKTVKLIIGKEDNKIEVDMPKNRLCEVSEFLSAACNEHWQSGRDGVINLEEEEPQLFTLFLAWAYTGRVENSEHCLSIPPEDVQGKSTSSSSGRKWHIQMIDCYLLGQRLLSQDFMNAAMDLIVKSYKLFYSEFQVVHVDATVVSRVYADTLPSSPLRKFFLDTILANSFVTHNPYMKGLEDFEPNTNFEEFQAASIRYLSDWIWAIQGKAVPRPCFERDPCFYHQHSGKAPGYSCTGKTDSPEGDFCSEQIRDRDAFYPLNIDLSAIESIL